MRTWFWCVDLVDIVLELQGSVFLSLGLVVLIFPGVWDVLWDSTPRGGRPR
jgi:hypothetical protein